MVDRIDHYQKAQDCIDDFMSLMADEMKSWTPEHFLMLGQVHAMLSQTQAFVEDHHEASEDTINERIAVVNFINQFETNGYLPEAEQKILRQVRTAIEGGRHKT